MTESRAYDVSPRYLEAKCCAEMECKIVAMTPARRTYLPQTNKGHDVAAGNSNSGFLSYMGHN